MSKLYFRKLRADEIETRVAKIDVANKKHYTMLLLYKDARCDMNILDETVGALNWMRSHSRDNANCTVSIFDKEKQIWISKEDTGAESFSEKEKGLASDSFKRACFNWGIGRELYTAPTIFINLADSEVYTNQKGAKSLNKVRFHVSDVAYNDKGQIDFLEIKDNKNKVRFNYGIKDEPKKEDKSEKKPKGKPKITETQIAEIRSLYGERVIAMMKHYKLSELSEMDEQIASELIARQKKEVGLDDL